MHKTFITLLYLTVSLLLSSQAWSEGNSDQQQRTLFKNVHIFDGKSDTLVKDRHVLVSGNKIERISKQPIETDESTTVIDGNGRTLMPGMIDAHVHLMLNANFGQIESNMTDGDLAIRSTIMARDWLQSGFTTARDVGGPAFPLKRAIDSGLVEGPRVYPSGAMVSQSSGHGDFRARNDPNPTLHGHDHANFSRMGISIVVDGRDAVLAATRQNLMQGATQIKIMAGGGGGSKYDPIDTAQYTSDEISAAVEAAADWGTYVTAHIFTPKAIQRAINAGVKSLEHAFFVDEPTVKLIAKKGVFVVPQTWGLSPELFRNPNLQKDKHDIIRAAHAKAKNFAPWLLKYKAKVAFGSDGLGNFDDALRSLRYEIWWRAQLFGSNFEVLKQATSVGGELMALSGPRNPYPGKLGVIEEGALADILLVDGNPLEDLSVLGAKDQWFDAPTPGPVKGIRLIMKDGKVYKNTL